jgi:phage shock protein A
MMNIVHFIGGTMIDRLITTLKGLIYRAAEDAGGDYDLALLSQQLRDAGAVVLSARKAVALATAQHEQDRNRIRRIADSIRDLEERTVAALSKGNDRLAREGAEAIAILEDEHLALIASTEAFEVDLRTLNENLRSAEARLRELERGQKTASVREKVRAAGSFGVSTDHAPLAHAQETLERINDRQERGVLADKALAALSVVEDPKELAARLADAGCGAPLRSSADVVLDRLKSSSPRLIADS